MEKINLTVKTKLVKVLQVDDIQEDQEKNTVKDENQIAFENTISKIKEKIHNPNSIRAQKIQVLTMAPNNWSRKKVSDLFKVSERFVRDAKQQERSNGVCSLPPPRKGKLLPEDTIQKVAEFYENNEHSRIMPGMKDRISINKNVYQQKRLLLCTLKELYTAFKQQNLNIKIGISKFCIFRPKWCVSAGTSGTHAVCTIHQNVVLTLHAAGTEETYKNLLDLMVCNAENRNCMLQRCPNCPGLEPIKALLCSKFEDLNEDISFK